MPRDSVQNPGVQLESTSLTPDIPHSGGPDQQTTRQCLEGSPMTDFWWCTSGELNIRIHTCTVTAAHCIQASRHATPRRWPITSIVSNLDHPVGQVVKRQRSAGHHILVLSTTSRCESNPDTPINQSGHTHQPIRTPPSSEEG